MISEDNSSVEQLTYPPHEKKVNKVEEELQYTKEKESVADFDSISRISNSINTIIDTSNQKRTEPSVLLSPDDDTPFSSYYHQVPEVIKPIITLFDESFEVIHEEGNIYLRHTKWPILTGVGRSLAEAEQDLLKEANSIADGYIDVDENGLSYEAIEMKNFLLKIIY